MLIPEKNIVRIVNKSEEREPKTPKKVDKPITENTEILRMKILI